MAGGGTVRAKLMAGPAGLAALASMVPLAASAAEPAAAGACPGWHLAFANVTAVGTVLLGVLGLATVLIYRRAQRRRVYQLEIVAADLRALLDVSDQNVVLLDREGIIKNVNAPAAAELGGAPDDLVGRSLFDFPWAEALGFDPATLAEVIASKTPRRVCMSHKDRWCDVTISPVGRDGGRLIGTAVSCRDITEQRESERQRSRFRETLERTVATRTRQLQESEGRLRLLTDSLPAMIAYVDREHRYRFNNKAYESWFGIPSQELRGRHVRSLVGESNYARTREFLNQALDGRIVSDEQVISFRNRGPRHIHLTWVPNQRPDGHVDGVFVLGNDITRQKRTEVALRHEKRQAENLLAIAGTIFVALDRGGRVALINRKGCELLGCEETDLIGRNWFDAAVPGDQRAKAEETIRRCLDGTLTPTGDHESEILTRSGERRLISWHNTVITDDRGLATGTLSSGEDITEQRRLERELLNLNQDLEARVRRRTAELTSEIADRKRIEEQLRKATIEAERANHEKTRFMAAASHDLRQPLQALNMFLSVLSDHADTPKTRELVNKIESSSQALGDLLDALLNISKLEAGLIIPEPERFPIDPLLARLVREFEPIAEAKGLRLRHVRTSALIRSDPSLLERILRNLLSNAIRYTKHGGVLVGCRRRGDSLRIQVCDTGPGIPAEKVDLIFQEYHRETPPEDQEGDGMGLGLAIVDRLAALMDHRIFVATRIGRGSTFSVAVPMVGVQPTAAGPRMDALAGSDRPVLIIDNDTAILDALRLQFEAWHFRVMVATSCREAIEHIRKRKVVPALVVADYRLDGRLDGSQAIAAVRRLTGRRIAGILITAESSARPRHKARAAGLAVLQKPVSAVRLYAITAMMLQQGYGPEAEPEDTGDDSPAR